MQFFDRDYTVRRMSAPYEVKGSQTADFTEETASMDVQVVVPSSGEFTPAGQRQAYRLNAWSACRFNCADPVADTVGDQMLFEDGFWYECVSCRKRNHTILNHWRSEWQRLPEGSEKYDGDVIAPVLTDAG